MTGLLASVNSITEAQIALDAGADVIDCKSPSQGALGALPPRDIAQIATVIAGQRLTSATTGDHVHTARELARAVRITAECGVDYIKFGLFEAATAPHLLDALDTVFAEHDVIAVCFVDLFDPTSLIAPLADCGVHGIMLDTANKHVGSLTDLWPPWRIADFIAAVRTKGLLCGLAGRLSLRDIPVLLPMGADYLGFRSALCGGNRHQSIDQTALLRVRQAIPLQRKSDTLQFSGVGSH